MSQTPVPRRRRRRTASDTEHNTDTFKQVTFQRRNRQRASDRDTTVSLALSTPLSSPDNVEPIPDPAPVETEANISSTTSKLSAIDRIRTELLEDSYHSQLVENDNWDETHNWTDEGEFVSCDYWHFLERYE